METDKEFWTDGKSWYAVIGDGNIVLTNDKDCKFKFSVGTWLTELNGLYIGQITKNYS